MKILYLILTLLIVGVLIAGCSSTTPTPSPTAKTTTPGQSASPSSNPIATATIVTSAGPITIQQLAEIQPGIGTVMIEYSLRMNNLWFAAQKNNWDMVHYQIIEMREIQETGETTRPGRATALKSFESGFLDPLDKAAQNKDSNAFTPAYDAAIAGCNSCHATSSSADFKTYKFVKITRPTASDFNNVDWAGQ